MLVSGITSFMLLFVLLLQTDAKPTSALRQKRAPKVNKRPLQFPRLGGKRSSPPEKFDSSPDIYVEEIEPVLNDDIIDSFLRGQNDLSPQDRYQESEVNKRGIQFPRLGRKRSSLADMHTYKYFYFPRMGRSAFYFPRMGRNQESADQEQSEEDIPCCNVGVSRAWGPEDPEPRRICPAAKCCGHLSSKVYVDSDLTVYEICVSDVAALPMEQKS